MVAVLLKVKSKLFKLKIPPTKFKLLLTVTASCSVFVPPPAISRFW